MRGGVECVECGQPIKRSYMQETLDDMDKHKSCFNCDFWLKYIEEDPKHPDTHIISDKFIHYVIGEDLPDNYKGFSGFGGSRVTITLPDGRTVVTKNLWYQGEIPEIFHDRWPIKPSKMVWG